MAAFGHCLPVELWLNIFDHIPDKQQLGQCKLVCKMWAQLAEIAMLKTVVLTKTNTPKLYQHLLEHPRSARHIQVVDISKYPVHEQGDLFDFMALAVTPSLKAIDADMCSNEFLDMLVEIVFEKPDDSLKLERLPVTIFATDEYILLASLLKKTLRLLMLGFMDGNMRESIQYITSNLNSFESLTDLRVVDLIAYIDSVPKLEDILKGCPHLKTLMVGVDHSPTRTATSNLEAWLSQHVQKVDSVETLFIRNTSFGSNLEEQNFSGGFYLDLLRYLSFKYPRVKHFNMDLYKQKSQPIARSLFENADTITLRNWKMDTMDHAEQTVDVWKSQNNSISIQYRAPLFSEEYACWMNVDKDKEANHTKFALTNVLLEVSTERIQQLLSSLGNTLTMDFEIDLKEYQENDLSRSTTPLIFLHSTPYIQHLKVKSNHLVQEVLLAPLTRLHTLELEGVKLETLLFIYSWAPHLKHLTFTSCIFAPVFGIGQIPQRELRLPELALDTLIINGGMFSQDLSIFLVIASSPPSQIFYAAPSQPIVRATREEVESQMHGDASIRIMCKSLKYLSVNLNQVTVKIEFDEKGNVIESFPAVENSPGIQLKQLKQDLQSQSTENALLKIDNSLLKAENALLKTEKQAAATSYERAKKYLTEAQIQAIEKPDI